MTSEKVILTCFSANSKVIFSSESAKSLINSLTVFLGRMASRFGYSLSNLVLVKARRCQSVATNFKNVPSIINSIPFK